MEFLEQNAKIGPVEEMDRELKKLEATKEKMAQVDMDQPPSKYEKYELEVYNKLKKDKFFVHYLDTFLNRRNDALIESFSGFPFQTVLVSKLLLT